MSCAGLLSEVHVGAACEEEGGHYITTVHLRYAAAVPPLAARAPATDSDGDLVLPRRRAGAPTTPLRIHHLLSTDLSAVGCQLWRAAFLLADLVIARRGDWSGDSALELGAGVGLVSLVAAMFAEHVFLTDGQCVFPHTHTHAESAFSLSQRQSACWLCVLRVFCPLYLMLRLSLRLALQRAFPGPCTAVCG